MVMMELSWLPPRMCLIKPSFLGCMLTLYWPIFNAILNDVIDWEEILHYENI
jgi:hypothetical protein